MKKRSLRKLSLKKGTVSNLKNISGGKEGGMSVTKCDTVLCVSRFHFCPPPHES